MNALQSRSHISRNYGVFQADNRSKLPQILFTRENRMSTYVWIRTASRSTVWMVPNLVWILVLHLSSFMNLSWCFNFSELQFPHLTRQNNNNEYSVVIWSKWGKVDGKLSSEKYREAGREKYPVTGIYDDSKCHYWGWHGQETQSDRPGAKNLGCVVWRDSWGGLLRRLLVLGRWLSAAFRRQCMMGGFALAPMDWKQNYFNKPQIPHENSDCILFFQESSMSSCPIIFIHFKTLICPRRL